MFSSVLLPLLFFSIILDSQPMTLLPTSVRKWKHSEENFHRLPSPHLASCRHWYLPILLSCHCLLFFPMLFYKVSLPACVLYSFLSFLFRVIPPAISFLSPKLAVFYSLLHHSHYYENMLLFLPERQLAYVLAIFKLEMEEKFI